MCVCVCVCVFKPLWKAASRFQLLCRLTIAELISLSNTEDDKKDMLTTGKEREREREKGSSERMASDIDIKNITREHEEGIKTETGLSSLKKSFMWGKLQSGLADVDMGAHSLVG